jgi:hypothetical protein
VCVLTDRRLASKEKFQLVLVVPVREYLSGGNLKGQRPSSLYCECHQAVVCILKAFFNLAFASFS